MTLRARIPTLLAVVGGGVLGTAAPALAADFQLSLSAPATGTVGAPILIKASASDPPPSVYPFSVWLKAVELPMSVMPTCPATSSEALQIAPTVGGSILDIALPERVDASGQFTGTIAFTPFEPGATQVCAYTTDEVDNVFAAASAQITVAPAGGTPGGGGPGGGGPGGGAPGGGAPGGGAPGGGTPGGGTPPGASPALSNVGKPRLSRSGAVVACSPGRWSATVRSYSYRWILDGRRSLGAKAHSLHLTRALRGHVLKCTVTATGASGQSASATSAGLRVR
jgi:hypothetical protein